MCPHQRRSFHDLAERGVIATIGDVRFVAPEDREQRIADLEATGVAAVISSWGGLLTLPQERVAAP